MSALAKLNSSGQLTIPKEILDDLKLAPGTEFTISIQNRSVVATPATERREKTRRLMDLAGILGKPPTGESLAIEDMNDAIGQAVADDDARIMREWAERHR
jgi:antitoxin PrlF